MKKRNLLILALASFSLFSCAGIHVHSYGEWKTSKVATCKEAGEEKRKEARSLIKRGMKEIWQTQ